MLNLQSTLSPDLWKAVSRSYVSELYTNAILDSIKFLTETIREKSGLDGDGSSLIGQVFGGDNPRIKINKLQSQSEKDEQKGLQDILRGLYTGVRNPRSHDQYTDSRENAESIIIFVDYLLKIINQSKGPFLLEEWVNRVFDPDFFVSDRYIELLIDEIPNKKRIEVLISLYKRGLSEAGLNLQSVFRTLLTRIGEENLTDFVSLVSEEFKIITDEYMLEQSLMLFPGNLWLRLSEASRLRIENKLLRSVENGQTGLRDDSFENEEYLVGRLGIMSVKIIEHISLKKEFRAKIRRKILKGGADLEYVVAYFLEYVPLILYNFPSDLTSGPNVPYNRVVQLITKNYTRYSPSTKARMQNSVNQLPEDWRDLIIKEIPDLEDIPF